MAELNPIMLQTMCLGYVVLGVIGLGLVWMWWTERIPLIMLFITNGLVGIGFIIALFVVAALNGIPVGEVFKVLFWMQMINRK